jgi:hypothetical protein
MITFGSACLMRTDNSRAAKPATTKDDRFHHPIFDKQAHVSSPPPKKQNKTPVSLLMFIPPKTSEWTAPSRTTASMATTYYCQ